MKRPGKRTKSNPPPKRAAAKSKVKSGEAVAVALAPRVEDSAHRNDVGFQRIGAGLELGKDQEVGSDAVELLQRLPQFHTALTKGRKSDNPIIFGYQGKAQLEVIYGHLAEVMLSQPATRIIMKTGEPKSR